MNKFGIILGEPNSINSEILGKSKAFKSKAIIIGNYDLLYAQLKILKLNRKLKKIKKIEEVKKFGKILHVYDVPLKFKNPFFVDPRNTKVYVKKCFDIGHKFCLQKKLKGIINCPINKKNVFKNKIIGITEFLAKKNKVLKSEVMIIYNKKLSVVPLTTHIKVKQISKFVKKDLLMKKINTLNSYYQKYFKKKPKIEVLGLNPHNFEFSNHSEEKKLILPAIIKLKNRFNISGPYSSDTIFIKDNLKKFDVVVGMYHDQVLAPFKALFGFDAVNITLGLPYIRMSPDHGVAEDKKKKNISSPQSLNRCIEIISNLN